MTQALVSKFFENVFFSYLQKQIFQYSTFLKLNSLACSFQAHLQIFKASNFQNGKDAIQLQRYCNYLVFNGCFLFSCFTWCFFIYGELLYYSKKRPLMEQQLLPKWTFFCKLHKSEWDAIVQKHISATEICETLRCEPLK